MNNQPVAVPASSDRSSPNLPRSGLDFGVGCKKTDVHESDKPARNGRSGPAVIQCSNNLEQHVRLSTLFVPIDQRLAKIRLIASVSCAMSGMRWGECILRLE